MQNKVELVFAGAASAFALGVGAASAQTVEEDGDVIVVTASRKAQDVRDIPASVEVIDEQQIELTSGAIATDLLKKNASVDVIQYPGGISGVGMRGFRPEYSGVNQSVLVLINGRPAGATSMGNITGAGLSRVEVVKGSASAIYGPSAMGGVVNYITRESRGEIGGNIGFGYGSFDTRKVVGNIGGALTDQLNFDLGVRHYRQADDFELGEGGETFGDFVQGNGAVRENTTYEQNSYYARLAYALNENWEVQGRFTGYTAPDAENPGAESDGVSGQSEKDDKNFGGDFRVTGSVGAHDLYVLYYQTFEDYELRQKLIDAAEYVNSTRETRFKGVQAQDNISISDAFELIVGADWGLVKNESRSFNADGSEKGAYSPNFERENYGVFADLTTNLLDDRLIVNVGGRYDWIEATVLETRLRDDLTPGSSDFGTFNPRAGLVFRPMAEGPWRFHASAGTGFVVPEANQIAGLSETVVSGQTRILTGNPDLNPEKSQSYDFGVGYDGRFAGLDLTYFILDVEDRISSVVTTNTDELRETTYVNALGSKARGLEASLEFDVLGLFTGASSNLVGDMSLTHYFKREEELASGTRTLRNVAETKINFGLAYDDGVRSLRISGRHVEGMEDTDYSAGRIFTGGAGGQYEYQPFTVYDISGRWRLTPAHAISVKIDNLTDKYYYEKLDYPFAGRSIFAEYTFTF